MKSLPFSEHTKEMRFNAALNSLRGDGGDRSFDNFMLMYDENVDGNDPDWLNLLGVLYDQTKSSHFDPDKSHAYFMRAAELGQAAAAYNLAVRWLHGSYGSIDVSRAQDWFTRAWDLGHGCGGASLSAMMMSDPEYGTEGHEEYTKLANDILIYSEEYLGGPWARFYMATLHSSGRLGERKPVEAYTRYLMLAQGEVCGPPKASAVEALAAHFFLGFLVEACPERAIEIMAHFPRDETQANIRYGAANTLDRLAHIIKTEILPHRDKERQENKNQLTLPPEHQAAQELVSGLYFNTISYPDTLRGIQAKTIPATRALADRLWAAAALSRLENDGRTPLWNAMMRAVQARLLSVSEDLVEKSSRDYGLQYNRLTPEGNPIPGEFASVQATGNGKFLGLRGRKDGGIDFAFAPSREGEAPLILREDIAVVLALAFGDLKGVVWPSVSVESIDKELPDRPRWLMAQKIWEPTWLGHTQLGKTFYAADYWIGQLAWNSKHISTDAVADPQRRALAYGLLSSFAMCGGREDGLGSRVMLRPDKMNWTWRAPQDGDLTCDLHNLQMRIDGSDKAFEMDGTENKTLNLNDGRFATGRIANLLTQRYDDIAAVWPMYERLRQLNGLILATFELRKRGFQPDADIRATIASTINQFATRPALQLAEKLVI